MKEFNTNQVDDIIKLKFGRLVTSQFNRSYISNRVLGQIFGVGCLFSARDAESGVS